MASRLLAARHIFLTPVPSRQASVVLLLYTIFVRQQPAGMTRVSVSDLRQNLPAFLKRVQAGEQLQITSRGRIIARIEPEGDPAEEARQWLLALRDRVSLGDVVSPIPDLEWSGDANHL
jgi:prevent-host-death family protein